MDKIIHDNTMLHLGLWQKKNRKLKKKSKRLSRALINLKFKCLMRKPRMTVVPRKKKRRLDVLAEVSEHMNCREDGQSFGCMGTCNTFRVEV